MRFYVLPVSGGGFPVQLALLKAIYEASISKDNNLGIRPDIVLSSSGGNVAAYLSMLGNWSSSAIMKNIDLLDSNLFVSPWTPPFFPSWIAFPLTKSIYRNGDGIIELFKKVFTTTSINTTEIWTGTYNYTTQKAKFFCNKSYDDCLIKDNGKESYIYDMDKLEYLDSNITNIAKVCHASASIPIITKGVMINDELYVDGGLAYSSPVIPMSPKINELITKKSNYDPIQFYYFCSYNMNDKFSDSLYVRSIGLLIHSSILQDRAYTINLLREYGKLNENPEIYENLDSKKLSEIIEKNKNKSYVMMLSPKNSLSLSLASFKGKDVVKIINEVETNFSVFIWTMIYRY